jgi:hypothetical protein
MNSIKQTITREITTGLQSIAPAFGVMDPDRLAQELLVRLGIVERTTSAVESLTGGVAAPKEEEKKEKKERKRMVSGPQRKEFMALEGATEEKFEEVKKAYKDAPQDQIDALMVAGTTENAFILYARSVMNPGAVQVVAAPQPEVKTEVEEEAKTEGKAKAKKPRAKKEKGRVEWKGETLKQFTTIVQNSGGTVTDALKQEFVDFVGPMSEEAFGVVALTGHMRAFVEGKGAAKVEPKFADEDEDLVVFTFKDEELLMGAASGKIFRPTTEAGDLEVGQAGVGVYKDVKRISV